LFIDDEKKAIAILVAYRFFEVIHKRTRDKLVANARTHAFRFQHAIVLHKAQMM